MIKTKINFRPCIKSINKVSLINRSKKTTINDFEYPNKKKDQKQKKKKFKDFLIEELEKKDNDWQI